MPSPFPESALAADDAARAIRIIDRLRESGFLAVLAGGCVRDALLGRTPKDFDVATDATPDSVRRVFGKRHTLAFGASFGVIGVLPEKLPNRDPAGSQPITPIEVATFRADGQYSDGRRPDSVSFGDARADALRRDFTINGMFYDPHHDEILDFVGGLDDLQSMHLRTIGVADTRFEEDKLRMLRAVRFVTTLGLTIEPSTRQAIETHADTIGIVSGERIGAEMRKILTQNRATVGLRLLADTGLHRHVWPGIDSVDFDNLAARIDRIGLRTFEVTTAVVLLTMHDSPAAAESGLRRLTAGWRLSTAEQRAITTAIHSAGRIADCAATRWSDLQPLLVDRDVETTLGTAEAIAESTEGIDRAKAELRRHPDSLDPPPLLSGNDLIRLGFPPGKRFKEWLAEIRRLQLDGELESADEAIAWVGRQSQDE